MKDASSTDVVVHAGRAISLHYQCGEAYAMDPTTLAQHGPAAWAPPGGVSAHAKLDPATGELMFFRYGTTAPLLEYGVVDAHGTRTCLQSIDLPGPRLPHDLAFTERFAVLNDLPLFWQPDDLARGVYRPRWHPELASRFALVPRHGGAPRWFEAAPTYVLHWINAYEDGDEVILDGYFQTDPVSKPDPADGAYGPLKRMVDAHAMGARPHRWRFNLRTGATREERLFDEVSEFPSIHYARPGRRHRFVWSMTLPPGWFLFDGIVRYDLDTGAAQRWRYPDGVYASEAPMAPRPGATAEDDGWLVTFVTDLNRDCSECHVFDAARIADGPIARIALPARMPSGTHACWAPASALSVR
jgi:carotenoid cleavage dioxygenase